MKYAHIVQYVATTPWAILPEKLSEIVAVLAFRAAGQAFTPEEIQAQIGARAAGARAPSGSVAVIPIRGTIAHRLGSMEASSGGTSAEGITAMLRQVAADDTIGTIVYDVDSPGGTVPGIQELAAEMFALRGVKHQIAVANSTMASAAYWLASQADDIVSIPSGRVGSIGVFAAHEDLSAALEKEGIKVTLISAGKHKVEGNAFAPLSEEARAFMQDRVDAVYGQFVKDVARGRGVSVSDVKGGYGEGRALDAKAAKAAGLVDRIGTMDETLGRIVGRTPAGRLRAELPAAALAAALVADEDADADRARRRRML